MSSRWCKALVDLADDPQDDATKFAVEVRGLRVETPSGDPIVEDMSFKLAAGEALGIVGESGSGKTTAVLSLLGYTQAGARITAGEVLIGGRPWRPATTRPPGGCAGGTSHTCPRIPEAH